jgi:hypothetical protein
MNPPSRRCAATWQTLPELALGIADGEERAVAIEHLAGCPDCRHELEELTAIADSLLALVPQREPPPGFEARVLDRLETQDVPSRSGRRGRQRRQRRGLGRLSFVAGTLAGAAAVAVALTISFSSDRQLAAQYRAALQSANGQYFQSARLRTPDDRQVGTLFAYQGAPSWLFYVLRGSYGASRFQEQIVTRTGKTVTLPPFRPVAASWGIATPIPVRDIALVRLIRDHGATLQATLPVVTR